MELESGLYDLDRGVKVCEKKKKKKRLESVRGCVEQDFPSVPPEQGNQSKRKMRWECRTRRTYLKNTRLLSRRARLIHPIRCQCILAIVLGHTLLPQRRGRHPRRRSRRESHRRTHQHSIIIISSSSSICRREFARHGRDRCRHRVRVQRSQRGASFKWRCSSSVHICWRGGGVQRGVLVSG